jgi:Ca-activated chloride channel family protein
MRRYVPVLAVLLALAGAVHGRGLLVPEDKSVPPLAMLHHKVAIGIQDQVAITKVEQTFRNHTERELEASYVFPVPKGASVNQFTMLVDGKEVKGEMVEAAKAREIYQSIVRRTQDPGLLEYMGNNLFRVRVYPVPAKGDQKVTLTYTSVANREGDLVEYIYPLKTDGRAPATLEEFSITATIKSQHAVQNVYSPTHSISLKRSNDREVTVHFEKNQGLLDKDFQLYYSLGDKDVGLTALTHRPIADEKGYFLLLVTPKVEIKKEYQVPRDMVFVLDTSGSMRGPKMEQAQKALKYCLKNLSAIDRFAVLNFATTVNRYKDGLLPCTPDQIEQATKWVDDLNATGGTAINDALAAALELRPKDEGRTFTVVFFTDGQPTIGETDPEKILKRTLERNTGNTRIFTFGVGHDLNATLLDRLAEETRAVSTYVKPEEDIEVKVSALYGKISHPILANLKLSATNDISLVEVYPPQLPDLFHGSQLVVLGRYSGKGAAAIKLNGTVGKEAKEFVYELTFADKTKDDRGFVEHLWARRKVGYLLDQIRANGEKKELVDEVTTLAKKYGITTPYTSYLIVPDGPMPVANAKGHHDPKKADVSLVPAPPKVNPYATGGGIAGGTGNGGFGGGFGGFNGGLGGVPAYGLLPKTADGKQQTVTTYARTVNGATGTGGPSGMPGFGGGGSRSEFEGFKYSSLPTTPPPADDSAARTLRLTKEKLEAYEKARKSLGERAQAEVQTGKLGVDLSVNLINLRTQSRLDFTALREANGRRCLEVGGVWIDEGFSDRVATVVIKAQSDAYFRILERQPQMREVYQLSNYLVWVTPSGVALVIDTSEGKEKLSDHEIDMLFAKK